MFLSLSTLFYNKPYIEENLKKLKIKNKTFNGLTSKLKGGNKVPITLINHQNELCIRVYAMFIVILCNHIRICITQVCIIFIRNFLNILLQVIPIYVAYTDIECIIRLKNNSTILNNFTQRKYTRL